MKKLFTMLAMLMLVLQYSMAGEATLKLDGSVDSDPEGFFTCAGSFNSKFNGAEYAGTNFTKGLKMDSSGKVTFTTTKVSTVTIVQSTWSANTIKLDDTELAVADAVAGTGCRIYTITDVAAGDHTIARVSGESGLFYVKVEWVDVYTATYNNTKGWTDVYAYAWVGDGSTDDEKLLGAWPGKKLTAGDDGKYLVEISNTQPEKIIFNNNAGKQTADFVFKNGAEYNFDGRIVNKTAYTATFTTEAEWEHVYAYCWNNTEGEEALGEWPGTEITADAQGVYAISLEAEYLPEGILFNDGNGTQTPDYVFADGAAFEYYKSTYTVTFTTDTEWDKVYAWAWSGTGDNTVNHCAPWPGTELTAVEGVYTFEYKAFSAPENILFNGGDDTKKTPDWNFTDGKAYKYITATPIYALAEGDTFTAGTTVNVKDADGDVVATITYGVTGGADFNPAVPASVEGYLGYGFYTAGNGQNGSATGGTLYTINPLYAGTISVAVRLNGGKNFYIQEDGESMEGYDGITIPEAANVVYSFPVKAGSTYKIYCTGSKLGFFGFDYKFEKVPDYYVIGDNGTKWVALGKMNYYDPMEEYNYNLDETWTGKYFAIAPASALNGDGDVVDWSKVVRPNSEGNFLVELRKYYDDVVIGGNNVWEKTDEITRLSIHYYIDVQDFALYPESDVTISDAGYATYSNKYDYFTGDAKVSIVKNVEGNKAVLEELEFLDGENKGISGGTGVILEKVLAETDVVTIYPYEKYADNEYVDVTGNMLIGSGNYTYNITGEYPGGGNYTAYILAKKDKGVGFYLFDDSEGNDIPAHKAFLAVPGTNAAPFFGFADAETTGIHSLTPALSEGEGVYYTLDGRRVEKPTKGLYIVNGKKVLVP